VVTLVLVVLVVKAPLLWVLMEALAVMAVMAVMAVQRTASIPWLAMAETVVRGLWAALVQTVSLARAVKVVPVVMPRVAQHNSEQLAVTVVPVVPVVYQRLMAQVPVAKVALVVQGLMRLPLRL
jgi:hypothetical protein